MVTIFLLRHFLIIDLSIGKERSGTDEAVAFRRRYKARGLLREVCLTLYSVKGVKMVSTKDQNRLDT